MADFLDVAQELYASGFVKSATPPGASSTAAAREESFRNVFAAIADLQAVHSKSQFDIKNLESIFTAFELAKTLQKFPNRIPEEIDKLIEDLKRVIVITLESTMHFPVDGGVIMAHPMYHDLVAKLFKQPEPSSVAFLSFNYDLALDIAFLRAQIPMDYGLSTKTEGAPLLKLHGSLNWGYEMETRSIIPWAVSHYLNRFKLVDARLDSIRQARVQTGSLIHHSRNDTTSNKQIDDVPVIVPPSWNKADNHRLIAPVWTRAAQELGEADSIFVIGYSLPETDAFFRLLYALGSTGRVPLKRFWLYSPDPSREAVFRAMLGPGATDRFRYIEAKAPAAFTHITETLRPKSK